MLAYFGTDVDWGKSTVGVDVDGMKSVGAEWRDKEGGCQFLQINSSCNSAEEVGVYELFPGVPDVAVLLIYDGVLMGVVVVGGKARWGGKEVGKGEEIGSERSEEGGWRQQGRGGDGGDGGFNNGRGNILNWDIFKVNNFTWELKLRPIILSEWGKEAVEFGLGKADDVGGGLFTELFKIELGCGAKGFKGGLWGRWGRGSDDIGVRVDGAGFEGVGVNEEDVGVGRQGGVDGGGSRINKRKAGDDELGAGGNSG